MADSNPYQSPRSDGRSVVLEQSRTALAMLAAAIFVFIVGVAGTLCAMRSAVGKYDWHDAVFGLSPLNLEYSLQSGCWSGGIGVAGFLLASVVCALRELRTTTTIAVSVGFALGVVAGITGWKWVYWLAMAAV